MPVAQSSGSGGGNDSPPTAVTTPPAPGSATSIAVQPRDAATGVGGNASFTVESGGITPLGYQWTKNGVPISGANSATYTATGISTADSASVFRAIVRGSAGETESTGALLTVSGGGARLLAGLRDFGTVFSPTFNTRIVGSSIAADANDKVYVSIASSIVRSYTNKGKYDAERTAPCSNAPGMVIDKNGNFFLVCGGYIYRMTADGKYTAFAGDGRSGTADGKGLSASFRSLSALAIAPDGTLYVADQGNGLVRRVTVEGVVSTIAGSPRNGSAVDGAGSAARFIEMTGIAVDASGIVYITDRNAIRKVSPTGTVSTFAGSPGVSAFANGQGNEARFGTLAGIAIDATGNLYVSDATNFSIRKVTPSGQVSTIAGNPEQMGSAPGTGKLASFGAPGPLTMAPDGNLIILDTYNGTLRAMTPTGLVTSLVGAPLIETSAGSIDGLGQEARFRQPSGLGMDAAGNIYAADTLNHSIRRITPAGKVTTLAGSARVSGTADGQGASASFRLPEQIAVTGNGTVFVLDGLAADMTFNTLRRIDTAGNVTTVKLPADPEEVSPSGVPATVIPELIAADPAGNLYVMVWARVPSKCPAKQEQPSCAGYGRNALKKLTPAGTMTTLLSTSTLFPGSKVSLNAAFAQLMSMVVDRSGNIFLGDRENDVILKLSPSGALTVHAGTPPGRIIPGASVESSALGFIQGLTLDGKGNIYVIDGERRLIRKVSPSGAVSLVAGRDGQFGVADGPLPGMLAPVDGLTSDESGNLYVSQNNGIVKIIQP